WLDQVHIAGHRLNNDAGDIGAEFGERSLDAVDIVVVQYQRVAYELFWHACGSGVAESQHARARLDQQAVRVTVIAAFELDDLAAAGGATRQAYGRHRGLGA